MDVVVSRPAGLERWTFGVRFADGKSATAIALRGTESVFRSAEQERQRGYKGHAQALIVELRGGIASTGLSLLEQLSREAAIAKPSNGSPTRRCDSGVASWNQSWPSKQLKHCAPCTAPPIRRSTPVHPV